MLLGGFAGLALVLAGLGLYGVTAYVTALRTREFGIRMALGADPVAVVVMVIRQTFTPIGVGIGLGTVSAWMTTGVLREWLYGVTPTDPRTTVLGALMLAAVAAVACVVPARRATRVDPVAALRSE